MAITFDEVSQTVLNLVRDLEQGRVINQELEKAKTALEDKVKLLELKIVELQKPPPAIPIRQSDEAVVASQFIRKEAK